MFHPRARTMLLLSLPALIIGVASSLVLIAAMKVASVFQQFLWQRLPTSIGIAYDSPFWIVGMLTLTGIVVGLIIRYSPGHAGPDPAIEPLISMPVSPSALPGLLLALIIGLAGGVSLGPEHPIMTINIALAAASAPACSAYYGVRLDDSGLSGYHRRAVRHARRRSADFFANA